MSSIQGIATNKKIIEIITDYRNGLLVLKPRFQRNLVWNIEHKVAFLDTIQKGLPFPEVYFCDGELDLKAQKTTIWVVDGQQRLSTIFEYVDGTLDLTKQKLTPFASLTDAQQRSFLNYVVVVRSLGMLSDEETKEIFRRINSVGYALNSVEIDNALYEGDFISVAKELANNSDFKALEILTDQEVSRMKDVEFMLLIIASAELGVYFTQDNDLQKLIKRFDDEYPNKGQIKSAIEKALGTLSQLNVPYDSLWYRKTSMFSLITEFGKYYLSNPTAILDTGTISEKLLTLEEKILESKSENPDSNKYAKYYKHMFQQTTSRTGRIARGSVIAEIF